MLSQRTYCGYQKVWNQSPTRWTQSWGSRVIISFKKITNNRIRLELGEEEKIPEAGSAQKKESASDEKMLMSVGKST